MSASDFEFNKSKICKRKLLRKINSMFIAKARRILNKFPNCYKINFDFYCKLKW